MKKLLAAVTLGVAGAIGVTGALAQGTWPSVKVTPTVSPNKAGTKTHPQGVKLKTVINWQTLGAADQPVVTHFLVLFPKGSLFNGAKYPTCSVSTLNKKGPSGCSKASIMGSGTGNAYADQVITHPQITIVNGGATKVYFYTVLNNPARVQEPVVGHIKKMSGKWGYSLAVTVPQNLLVVAGVPIELTSLRVSAGKGSWLATTACPGGHWPFSVTTSYQDPNTGATGQSSFQSAVACKK
jgi:hypothetical protein